MSVHPIKQILSKTSWLTSDRQTPIESRHGEKSFLNTPPKKIYLTSQHIAWLWEQMVMIYGQLFVMKHGTTDKQGAWLDTLKDLTPIALESGMKRLKGLSSGEKFIEFPPNCLQFRALCLAYYDDLLLPSAGAAFDEIAAHYREIAKIKNPILQYTASKFPPAFFETLQKHEAFKLFKTFYEGVCSLVKQGHPLPQVNLSTHSTEINKSVSSMHVNQMKTMLGVSV